ncbi:hypothetical protein L226DRAFT_570197 [Lentinus tigrinus ALCF2SS1-7]|uniref:uncharacterized protein n=1 Tax=Lentinus tigrinus ALCF2SS1-7 TaxID=1328758 RepID=UPI001165EB7F|nr:hypothetical protein L226DRAFT_570197 [Lentinus tigrinus ALCF2SS1-7]
MASSLLLPTRAFGERSLTVPSPPDVIYTLPLHLARKQNRSELDLWGGGNPYQLAIDTADCSFWFYELKFKNVTDVSERPDGQVDFKESEWSEDSKHIDRKVIPPGDSAAVKEDGWACYGDTGSVHVRRWEDDHDLKFQARTWDCTNNTFAQTFNWLFFPRILADYANDTVATQASDGNLGMAVPGWRAPWKKVKFWNRVTFWDILRNGQEHVETPMQATVRLLYPDDDREAVAAENVQSFLYHGKGSPCGMLMNGTMLLPNYSPPLYIFPHTDAPTEFHFWTLQFLSMTLLEPVQDVPHLDHETVDPTQWVAKRIAIKLGEPSGSEPDSAREETSPGLRVILDSCSASTVLPKGVLRAIWTNWFEQPLQSFPAETNNAACLWHNDPSKFARHDIIFEFMDSRGTVFDLRCSAQDFLTSPWMAKGEDTRSAQFQSGDDDHPHWILGMNFFWTTLLKLNGTHRGSRPVPGTAHPYVQFAPQRIVRDGQLVGTAWDLGLHKYLAPRHLAEVHDQPEIHTDE